MRINKHIYIFLIGLRNFTLMILGIVTFPIWIFPVVIYCMGDEHVMRKAQQEKYAARHDDDDDVGGPC